MADAVSELRLVVTVEDYEGALRFYRDVLGLEEIGAFDDGAGRVSILDAGRATLELSDLPHAEHIDVLEVGRRVAGRIRVALKVPDAAGATDRLVAGGATLIAAPRPTPWGSLNSRLDAPGELQLTLFQEVEPET
jgi:catechol 2,3-dioxygenase-like lactoylglutathione lyase family enzyme